MDIRSNVTQPVAREGVKCHSPWLPAYASTFLILFVVLLHCGQLLAQAPATTTIQDTVYKSDGSLAKGSVVITWLPFITADNKPVFGGTKSVAINNGSLEVSLVPNAGATPSGTSYSVKYYQSSSVYSEEIWVVSASGSPLTLSQVRVSVAPSPPVMLSSAQVTGTAIVERPPATQTITAPSTGGVVPLRLKGNLTANANLLEVYDSQSTPQLQGRFDPTGALFLGKSPTFSTMTQGSLLFSGTAGLLSQDNTNIFWNNAAKQFRVGPRTGFQAGNQSLLDTNTQHVFSALNPTRVYPFVVLVEDNTVNAGAGLYASLDSRHTSGLKTFVGIEGDAYQTTAGPVNGMAGTIGYAEASAGTITDVAALGSFYGAKVSGAAVTNLYGLYAYSNSKTGGALTNNYGLFIDNQAIAGVNNWAIKTGTGLVEFGDQVKAVVVGSKRIGNVRYADQFPGADAGEKIAAAHADLPSVGGTIDARGFEGEQTFTATLALTKPVVLLLGAATFTMTGGTTELIRIGSTSSIIGMSGKNMDNEYSGTILRVGTSVGATVDAIRIDGSTGIAPGPIDGLTLQGFSIVPQSGTPGRYGIHFDTTLSAIVRINVDQVNIGALGSFGVYSTNPSLNDGFFTSVIQNSRIANGIRFNRAGDTLRIVNNVISGNNIGVDVDFVAGATTLIIEGNNITNLGGGIHLGANAVSTRIINNEIETPPNYVGSHGAVIDLDGTASAPAIHVLVHGNSIQVISANSDENGIRINYANDTQVANNYISRGSGAAKDIVVTTNANDTRIGENRFDDATLANILSNSGTRTSVITTVGGITSFQQPVVFSNSSSLAWLDESGTTRSVLTTAGDGVVDLLGFHGRLALASSDGVTYLYDSNDPSAKTLSLHTGFMGVGTIGLPTSILTLGGNSAQTFKMERHTTANTAGNPLTIQAGGATSAATDKAGGALIVQPGLGTGSAVPGLFKVQQDALGTAAGTTDHAQVDRLITGASKVLANNTNTALVNAAIASNTVAAGVVSYAVEVFNGTDVQIEEGKISYHVTNKAGVLTNNTTLKFGNQQALTAGTLAVTWTITAASPAVLTINVNSSLTPSAGYPRVTYNLENLTQQGVVVQ